MKIFLMPNFKTYAFGNKFQWWSSEILHRILIELFQVSDDLANRPLWQSRISRVQLKSNWIVRADQEAVRECSLILLKRQLTFSNASIQNLFISKKNQWWSSWLIQIVPTELFRASDALVNQSFCWSDISRVQLKYTWTIGERLLGYDSKTVCKSRLILSKVPLIFLNGGFRNWIISKELTLKEFLYDVILH